MIVLLGGGFVVCLLDFGGAYLFLFVWIVSCYLVIFCVILVVLTSGCLR